MKTTESEIRSIIQKLMCVALVTSVVLPLGRMMYPYVAHDIGDLSFAALQAIFTAMLGMGIYAVFCESAAAKV